MRTRAGATGTSLQSDHKERRHESCGHPLGDNEHHEEPDAAEWRKEQVDETSALNRDRVAIPRSPEFSRARHLIQIVGDRSAHLERREAEMG
jgi:hypothetical protein